MLVELFNYRLQERVKMTPTPKVTIVTDSSEEDEKLQKERKNNEKEETTGRRIRH